MIVTITKPNPTFSIKLKEGRGNLELTKEEFIELYDNMTAIYNENYELINDNEYDF